MIGSAADRAALGRVPAAVAAVAAVAATTDIAYDRAITWAGGFLLATVGHSWLDR